MIIDVRCVLVTFLTDVGDVGIVPWQVLDRKINCDYNSYGASLNPRLTENSLKAHSQNSSKGE